MIRVLIIMAVLVSLVLVITVSQRSVERERAARLRPVEPVAVRAIRVLREAHPVPLRLDTIADAIGETPGTVALDLAGNPAILFYSPQTNPTTRYYYIKER